MSVSLVRLRASAAAAVAASLRDSSRVKIAHLESRKTLGTNVFELWLFSVVHLFE
jgi:hypothetical protein